MDELIASLIEAVAALNQRSKDLETDSDETKQEINAFQSAYDKETKLLQKQIDDLIVQLSRLVKEEVSKIPTPKDGENGLDFDEEIATNLITKQIDDLLTQKDKSLQEIKSDLLKTIANEIIKLTPKDGIDGKNGRDGKDGISVTDAQIETEVDRWLKDNQELIKGKDGQSIKGEKGKDGEDGRGIENIVESLGDLLITFTDGSSKRIKLPQQQTSSGNIIRATDTTDLVVSASVDTALIVQSQVVLGDASSGNIEITMPEPSLCNNSGRSKRVAISKVEASVNTVKILPFGTETLAGDAFQTLYYNGEILNFITDGTNWYLGA